MPWNCAAILNLLNWVQELLAEWAEWCCIVYQVSQVFACMTHPDCLPKSFWGCCAVRAHASQGLLVFDFFGKIMYEALRGAWYSRVVLLDLVENPLRMLTRSNG